MASAIIHLAIAKKIEEKIQVDNKKDYYLGAIAPDISKQIGQTKEKSHFLINTDKDIPNIDLFKKRYPFYMYNSFDLGYFTHLYTDKRWFEDFLSKIAQNNSIKLLDGTFLKSSPEEIQNMIYSDYININIQLIEEYNLDLSLFYEEFQIPYTTIKEIPIEKLDILINKMGIIIENSKENKNYTFDIIQVIEFINKTADEIIKIITTEQ